MAAYAALVSLTHTIEQIEHHPRPPISLPKTQAESLTHNITFLQEFLERYSHLGYTEEADDLEMRIADAAYAVEDLIELHIVNRIHAQIGNNEYFKIFRGLQKVKSSFDFHRGLQKAMQDMDRMKKEALEKTPERDLIHRQSTPKIAPSTRRNVMVGFEDVLYETMDKLTDGRCGREIIPVVGMGGSGKTTLARNIYQSKYAVHHFDVLVWVTISQEYRVREILLQLLSEEGRESERQIDEYELGEKLHKRLSGRRYLIILDDIWDIDVWDQLRKFFPNNNNGSRIMLTTRLSKLAHDVAEADSNVIRMSFLDEDNSWDLFSKTVFGDEGCPFELKGIGKKIVKSCKGLPLSIVVVGGLLANTEHKQEYWERIGGNLSSTVNLEDGESCLKILQMSYTQLPVYLRPCFLYMGVFEEDSEIRVSTLVDLWVAEGFLKPIRVKTLEIVAKEYLNDLIDRNLILVHQLGSTGSIKFCKMHDLFRDLCLREAEKERFYNVITGQHSLPQSINSSRRIVVVDSISKEKAAGLNTGSLVRSLIWYSDKKLSSHDFRLLRILKTSEKYSGIESECFCDDMVKFVNSRYIDIRSHWDFTFVSSIYHLWNLQTLIFQREWFLTATAPSEIWNMPQLRHIECQVSEIIFPDPPSGEDSIVLVNLQKLMTVKNFKCGEEMVKRIPNVKKLKLSYVFFKDEPSDYCLNNLEQLHKLESLHCGFHPVGSGMINDCLRMLTFPRSLKKLTLNPQASQHWEDIMEKIGSLPFLVKLRIICGSFCGHEWETVEGQFRSLKFLEVYACLNLEYWTTDYTHFPHLERLVLRNLWDLKAIPSDIGEIPTLRSIEVICCSDSTVISAREIAMEQVEVGNEGLLVKVTLQRKKTETLSSGATIKLPSNEALMGLESSPNFQVRSIHQDRW